MKICRFDDNRLGLVEGALVRDVTAALDCLPAYRYPFPPGDLLIAHLEEVTRRARALSEAAAPIPLGRVKLLSPVANPSKIVAAPVNYQKHLDEVKGDAQIHQNTQGHTITIHKAGLFLKANTSLVGPGEGIALGHLDRRNDHEVELALVIGKKARGVSRAEALNYVAGYAIGLDITIRGTEDRSFRKSPDTYTVLGPWLVTADEIPNPGELDLDISVNGEQRQNSNTRYLILDPAALIELASSFYTLFPGDVIITGTPEGVSPIVPGDAIVAHVERVGSMAVRVREA
ncbi:MAG: fumarylacetoacetate hydrolase family protein [Acidobacteriota bacterium]|nr:fumarylacetoacetate hydrolase family protein [Acidobacteriota bacterium]